METAPYGCPTGILIDIGLQTKVLKNIKENVEDKVSVKSNKDQNTGDDTDSSHSRASNCLLDQTPPKTPSISKTNVFCTPKSNWKTPSPKSMKIITRDASRIVDRLYSSPVNCSEVMIYDEVFPDVNDLDYACFDEIHIKSRNLPATDKAVVCEKGSQNLTKCPISAVSNSSAESVVVPKENLSTTVQQSDIKPKTEHAAVSEKIMDSMPPENTSSEESCPESVVSDKGMIKSITCIENSRPALPESTKMSSGQLFVPDHEVSTHKKLPAVVKGFGFNKSIKYCAENNKENEHQSNGTRHANYGPKFSMTEKSCSSIENGTNETKTRKDQILKEHSTEDLSSTKCIAAKYSVLEKKNTKESQNLEDDLSKNMTGKPKALQPKSNIGRSKSLLYKKDDPLSMTVTLLGTPNVGSPIRRFRSFHDGSTRNALPTVEKKFVPTTESCCRVLKPKMPLNQVSNHRKGFTTPLQFEKYSESFKLAESSSANPIRRKSFAFNPNNFLAASSVKITAQKDQHSITKKPAFTSSSRLGFGKKSNILPSHPKFKKDNLPRKLFP